MIYREYKPKPPLAPWIFALWYARTPSPVAARQRVLPSGQAELVLNLAADACIGCAEGLPDWLEPAALLVGVRTVSAWIDSRDLAEIMGVSFGPGGLSMFFGETANRLSGETALEHVWGAAASRMRERLCETVSIGDKFEALERFLLARLLNRPMHPAVQFALSAIAGAPGRWGVERLARSAGLSSRRFSQLFTETVGIGPKAFVRVRRFRRALELLHTGADPCWVQLALELGYCDQAHFNRDFREFSGITPTVYRSAERMWAGHVTAPSVS